LDGPFQDWQEEGPGLLESIRRYRWLVATVVLVGALAAYVWSSTQPARYEGTVRVFLEIPSEESDPGRIIRSQAEFLRSPVVLDRTVDLIDDRLTRKELEKRLTVEPSRDANVITVRVLDATPEEAASLADTVLRAFRQETARQAALFAQREATATERRQRQLEDQVAALERLLQDEPNNQRLLANRNAKLDQLKELAKGIEAVQGDAARAARRAEAFQETAAIPDEPAQPKPVRNAAIGALLGLIAAAALAWWLNGRRLAAGRGRQRQRLGDVLEPEQPGTGLDRASPLRLATRLRDGHALSANVSGNGSGPTSGIADFDQIATSVQELFHYLDGPPQRLYEEDLPQLAAEEIAHRFQVDLAVVLLDNAGEIQPMGSVGLRATRTGTIDRGARRLIETAVRTGPRLVDDDELVRLASSGLGGDQADSLALVPLIRDQVGFGVLVAGRRDTGDKASPLTEVEVQEIAACTRDIVPYLWAWLLLRNLKLRLRTLQ
jgi:capsular polysaccharide biosynthesis protein